MPRWFIGALAIALTAVVSTAPASAQNNAPVVATAVVEVTVWWSVSNPADLYLSTRVEGGRWRTEDTALDMSTLSRSGNFHQSNAIGLEVALEGGQTAGVEVTVWRSVSNPDDLYLSTRVEGGRWRTESTALDMSALSRSGNFHQSNAVRVEVQLEAASPADDAREGDAGAFGYIPSLNATVVELRFFESGLVPIHRNARVYPTTFDRLTTRFISWHIELRYPPTPQRIDFAIETVVYRSDGSVWARYTLETYAHKGWTTSHHNMGWGSGAGPTWPPGVYRSELSVEGDTIAKGTFEVVDQALPDSGPFSDLREMLPWASGQPLTDDSQIALLALAQLLDADRGLATSVASWPWVREGPNAEGAQTLRQLAHLARRDLESTRKVATLPWLLDGIAEDEWLGVGVLAQTAAESAAGARLVADVQWADDGISEDERWALTYVRLLARAEPLAARVTALPWLVDDVTADERWLLWNLDLLALEHPQLASLLVNLPWMQDDITESERWTVSHLREIANAGLPIERVTAFPWLDDDVTVVERWLLWNLGDLAKAHLELAEMVVGFPWMQDDITATERWLLRNLRDLTKERPQLAKVVVGFPWMQDDITDNKQWLLWNLADLAKAHAELAEMVVGLHWLQDGVTRDERQTVQYLRDLAGVGVESVAGMPFLQTLSPADAAATNSLRNLALWASEALPVILEHPTISDGITDDEATVVSTLWGVQRTNPDLLDTLLDPTLVMLEERAIDLPHSGEVTLTIIRTETGQGRTLDLVEDAVRSVEELMDAPLPRRQVTFLFEDAVATTFFGTHFGTHITLSPKVDSGSLSKAQAYSPIIHEVAHYYWTGNAAWINEGVANLLESVVEGSFEDLPERDAVFPCRYARRISDLEDIGPRQRSLQFLCSYSLGFRLFRDLYRELGEGFWDGLRILYQKSQMDDDSDECSGTSLGACHVEAAFKAGATDEAIAAVDDVFDFWYEKREP